MSIGKLKKRSAKQHKLYDPNFIKNVKLYRWGTGERQDNRSRWKLIYNKTVLSFGSDVVRNFFSSICFSYGLIFLIIAMC